VQIHKLFVQWYEVYDKKSVWRGKFRPAMYGTRAKQLWKGIIHVDSVLAEFEKLTNKKVGKGAARRIRESLGQV